MKQPMNSVIMLVRTALFAVALAGLFSGGGPLATAFAMDCQLCRSTSISSCAGR